MGIHAFRRASSVSALDNAKDSSVSAAAARVRSPLMPLFYTECSSRICYIVNVQILFDVFFTLKHREIKERSLKLTTPLED